MRLVYKSICWAWGYDLGKLIRVKSWWPSFDTCYQEDWRQWGIAWPTILVDQNWTRTTSTPIWNWVWLCNRLGYGQ